MMSTPKKDGHYFNIYMERKLYEELQEYCRENGVTKTFAVEKGTRMYLISRKGTAMPRVKRDARYMNLYVDNAVADAV